MYGTGVPQGAVNPFDDEYEYEGNPFEAIPEVGAVQNSNRQQQLHDTQMAQLALEEDDEPFDVEQPPQQQQQQHHTNYSDTHEDFPGQDPAPSIAPNNVGAQAQLEEEEEDAKFYRPWNIAYYSKYFNVDTSEVLMRITRSLVPFSTSFFTSVENNPDLYGPFWIATTLIFVMTIVSNFAKWYAKRDDFEADFHDITFGSGAIYGYVTVLPIALWIVCKWLGVALSLVQIWCIYGYSLFVFIPASILCILPWDWVRWLIVGVATAMSLIFLIMNFFPPLLKNKLEAHKKGLATLIIMGVVALFTLGLGLTFKFAFFNYDEI